MIEVQFHVNLPDRVHYTCRLLRKALRKQARVAITGPTAVLAELDQALWAFEGDAFLPHLRIGAPTQASSPRSGPSVETQSRTPLWLVDDARDGIELGVLVNLGGELASGFESYQRVIEIVGDDEESRLAARSRWRQYVAMGCTPQKYEAVA